MKYLSLLIFLHHMTTGFSQNEFRPCSDSIIQHTYYSLEYSEQHEQAKWVYYLLTTNHVNGVGVRKNNFKNDPKIITHSASPTDYKGSGYDRGHMCPAGSMKLNQLAMDESFYMSNMSPQHPDLNRVIWRLLEEKVRDWVLLEDSLYVVTGPILDDSIGFVGTNKITIPKSYYKAIYDPTGKKKMIGFIMENKKRELPLQNYIVTIDSIENRIGIDLFCALSDSLENELESSLSEWDFKTKPKREAYHNTSTNTGERCKGVTNEGERCIRNAKLGLDYCWQHLSEK